MGLKKFSWGASTHPLWPGPGLPRPGSLCSRVTAWDIQEGFHARRGPELPEVDRGALGPAREQSLTRALAPLDTHSPSHVAVRPLGALESRVDQQLVEYISLQGEWAGRELPFGAGIGPCGVVGGAGAAFPRGDWTVRGCGRGKGDRRAGRGRDLPLCHRIGQCRAVGGASVPGRGLGGQRAEVGGA